MTDTPHEPPKKKAARDPAEPNPLIFDVPTGIAEDRILLPRENTTPELPPPLSADLPEVVLERLLEPPPADSED